MRRWLALFLLVLLPLLSGWSAASAYGGDLADTHSEHRVHHDDSHLTDGKQGATGDAPSNVPHADCDHCHNPGVTRLNLRSGTQAQAPTVRAPWTDVALRAPPASLPERPKWARLA